MGPKNVRPQKKFLLVLVCPLIADFGGVHLVALVLLVTWVIRTPYPLSLTIPQLVVKGKLLNCCGSEYRDSRHLNYVENENHIITILQGDKKFELYTQA